MAEKKKLYYKIGEACKALDIQPYVLRYWETEFSVLRPDKSKSGQRVYSESDLGVIRRIKELLYEEGFTIAGAKKRLAAELESGNGTPAKAEAEPAKAEPKAEKAPQKAKPAAKKRAAATKKSKATKPQAPAKELDTATLEELKQLRVGVRHALEEARKILALVDDSAG